MKIKKGDKVFVRQGDYRGKTSKVVKALPKEQKVVVEGVNVVKKRIRPQKEGEKGKTVEAPLPIPASRVQLVCGSCGPTRVGKDRVCKKCGKEI